MTNKTAFTEEEWGMIEDAAFSVGLTASIVDLNFWNYDREIQGLDEAMGEAEEVFKGNELIQDLMTQIDAEAEADEPAEQETGDLEYLDMKGEQIAEAELKKIEKVVSLVSEKATPQEAKEFRAFLYFLAEKVAKSGREGFLGLGPKGISGKEAAYLAKLKAVLGI